MVRIDDIEIPTQGGRPLAATRYVPSVSPRAHVIIHGATAVPQRFYREWATHLAERGIAVLTYDFRGIGRSRTVPIASERATMSDWIDDAQTAHRWLANRRLDAPLVAMGHSFGGQIATTLAPAADAIITVGAQGGYVGRYDAPRKQWYAAVMRGLIHAITRSFGYLPGWAGLGEDLPPGVARQWARWCSHPEYLLSELPHLRVRMAVWDGPMYALTFDDDTFATPANVKWLLDRFLGATIEHDHLRVRDLELRAVGHFGFFRRSAAGELWPRVDAFLARLGAPAVVTEQERILADLQYGTG
jgi:predicted alpha/beta hydrolase